MANEQDRRQMAEWMIVGENKLWKEHSSGILAEQMWLMFLNAAETNSLEQMVDQGNKFIDNRDEQKIIDDLLEIDGVSQEMLNMLLGAVISIQSSLDILNSDKEGMENKQEIINISEKMLKELEVLKDFIKYYLPAIFNSQLLLRSVLLTGNVVSAGGEF